MDIVLTSMAYRTSLPIRIKRSLLFVHRWLGVSLCVLFFLWFASGIGMMYWGMPAVSARDRLERAPALDPATIKLSPQEAAESVGATPSPAQIRLNSFDGRPVYRFGAGGRGGGGGQIVYADTGEAQVEASSRDARSRGRRLDRHASERGNRAVGHRDRPVDGREQPAQPAAAVEVFVAGRRPGVHRRIRRGAAAHDDDVAGESLSERRPALAVLHAAAEASAGLDPSGDLFGVGRHRRRDPRGSGRPLALFAVEEVPLRRTAVTDPVSRPEAMAHDPRADLRRRDRDVDLQRVAGVLAVPGAFTTADRRGAPAGAARTGTARRPWRKRRTCGRAAWSHHHGGRCRGASARPACEVHRPADQGTGVLLVRRHAAVCGAPRRRQHAPVFTRR